MEKICIFLRKIPGRMGEKIPVLRQWDPDRM